VETISSGIWFYIVKKLAMVFPVWLGISAAAFLLGVVSPSDPAVLLLSMDGISTPDAQEIAAKRHELGLDRSYILQYLTWLGQVLQGNLGISYITRQPVLDELLLRLPVTVMLAGSSLLLVMLAGIPLGVLMAWKKNTGGDFLLRAAALAGTSLPSFWLSVVLIWIFAENLQLLPSSGYGTIPHIILPAITLAAGATGALMRLQRATLLEVLEQNYIFAAKAKGLPPSRIIWRHGLPNALIPVVTLLGNYFGSVLGGSAVIEAIYSLPGLGSYVLEAIRGRDYPVIQGYVLFTGCIFVAFNLLVDLAYLRLNPRIRLGGK